MKLFVILVQAKYLGGSGACWCVREEKDILGAVV